MKPPLANSKTDLDAPPWERQRGETTTAFAAFTTFRDLPRRERSINALGAELAKRTAAKASLPRQWGEKDATFASTGKSSSTDPRRLLGRLRRWSRQWSWFARAAAWDAENERQLRLELALRLADMCERHANLALQLQRKVVERLKELESSELSSADLVRWLSAAARIEQSARKLAVESGTRDQADEQLEREIEHETDVVRRILGDPRATELACGLLERIAVEPGVAGEPGATPEPAALEAGPAPGPAQPPPDGPGGGTDHQADGPDAAAPRQE